VAALLLVGPSVRAEPAAPPADAAPVPLYRVEIVPPLETVGSGLAPAVSVRVTVSPRGTVSKVEIKDIRPPTPLDDLFRKATVDALTKWRFAPAIRAGQPSEATLEWTVQFKPREEQPSSSFSLSGVYALTQEDQQWDDLARWSRHLAGMPLEARRQALGRIRTVARNLLRGTAQEAASDHFVVSVDGSVPGMAKTIAQNLEATYACVRSILGAGVVPQSTPLKVQVVGYSDASAFSSLIQGLHGMDGAAGFYDPIGLLSFHREMETIESLLHIMIHEGTHAFLENHVVRAGVRFPLWLNEGFAEYVANSEIKEGRIVPGSTRPKQLYHFGNRFALFGKSEAMWSVEEVQEAIRKHRAIPLRELMTARLTEFYGEKRRCYYTEAWMLVHFLRHGRPSWAGKEFPDLVLYLAEGYPIEDAFRGVYGGDPASFTREFETYAMKF
jgi:hypothetical protein